MLHDAADKKQTRSEVAKDAGLSERQKVTALRVASVPQPEFEAAVESENPPTVTQLAELAEDIKQNGFDHRYPITVAEIDGQWMLLDGRNRREAARIAGINPPVIVTDIDPKLAVHRSNNQNRDATPGQKAMATAMAFPSQNGGSIPS